MSPRPLVLAATVFALMALGGCTYDYLNRSDRVAYSAGDAVKANIEQQTIDPSKRSMRSTKGLGQNGYVDPAPSP